MMRYGETLRKMRVDSVGTARSAGATAGGAFVSAGNPDWLGLKRVTSARGSVIGMDWRSQATQPTAIATPGKLANVFGPPAPSGGPAKEELSQAAHPTFIFAQASDFGDGSATFERADER